MAVKPLMPNPPGRLVCDEFSKGVRYDNWRPLGSGDWLMIYTVAGVGSYSRAGCKRTTETGDVILYAPGEEQRYGTHEHRWDLAWVHFPSRPQWEAWLNWPRDENGVRKIHLPDGEIRQSFLAAMRRMNIVSRRNLAGAADLAINALEESLLWARASASDDPWFWLDPRIRRAVDALATDFRQPFRLEALASQVGLSVSRFEHLFKAAMRCTPQQYLESQRMEHAKNLLRITSQSISEIASEVGYEDAFYFTNRFRRYVGRSPRAFRSEPEDPQ